MTQRPGFTIEQARTIGEQVGIDWNAAAFDVEQFRRGLEAELEHGLNDPATNVTDDDPVVTRDRRLLHPARAHRRTGQARAGVNRCAQGDGVGMLGRISAAAPRGVTSPPAT